MFDRSYIDNTSALCGIDALHGERMCMDHIEYLREHDDIQNDATLQELQRYQEVIS